MRLKEIIFNEKELILIFENIHFSFDELKILFEKIF
jgi:hypothetical protein